MANFRRRGKKWQYRIRYSVDGKQEEISKGGFRTKAEAKVAADKIEHEINMGVNHRKGDMLFIEYYKQWVDAYKMGVYSPETDRFYRHAITLVEKHFKNVQLKNITKEDYQIFLNEYSEGRAKETVRKTHTKIGAALRSAYENGYIQRNPALRPTIKGTNKAGGEGKYIHAGEAKKLAKSLLNGIKLTYTTRYMLILQLATGMRISEVMALQFKDLDFLHNRIDVNKSWDYKFTNDFKPTKNKESRNISVDKHTMDIIREFYDYQLSRKIVDSKQRLFMGKRKIPSIHAINKTLKRACERANIPVVTSHAMRHTHASMLILQGADLTYIADRLGHKDTAITAEVYVHVLKELREKNDKKTQEIFSSLY